ncbi:hemerythrin domain-containing protein [Empedobacter brevis]|uniref:hemerythrin domain-containing protein n=1 Tax=Empedobacter brevis TaxID=247 RepID=UPI0028999FA5|nr:hemerythrin domain-containing protein [Empedobacter brevis]
MMKRNEHIVLLSKDHHFGLLCSWKIEQGLNKKVELKRIADYVDYFWKNHLDEHFEQEEQILFPYSNDEYNNQIKIEHTALKEMVKMIIQQPEKELLENFALYLKNHIRFEERSWFPALQEKLNESELEQIGKQLNHVHQNVDDNYIDEFWK